MYLSPQVRSIILHSVELVASFLIPFLANALLHAHAHADVLVPLGGALNVLAKYLRTVGVLPDYVNQPNA